MYVESFTGLNMDGWAKGGLMFRDSLNANSKNFCLLVTGDNGLRTQIRDGNGGSTVDPKESSSVPNGDVWLKIEKIENTFQAFYKTGSQHPGNSWVPFGASNVLYFSSSTFYYGVAVTSHKDDRTADLKFKDFTRTDTNSEDQDVLKPKLSSPVRLFKM